MYKRQATLEVLEMAMPLRNTSLQYRVVPNGQSGTNKRRACLDSSRPLLVKSSQPSISLGYVHLLLRNPVVRTKPRWQLDKRSFALDRKRKAGREIPLTPSALEDYAAQEVDSRIPNGPGRYGGSG